MLELKNFSKKYAKNPNYSAKDISFSVEAGEVVGLVGSNGAGKSTIIKSVIGVLPFQEGKIEIGGYDITKQPEKAKKLVGYVPDDHSVYEKLTGREYINYMGSLYGATKKQKKYAAGELAERFGIKYALDTQIASYSHGMRQKICILGALVHRPKLWILDEPMVGLDHQTMMLLCNYIREYADANHAVLFSSHNLEVVRKVCDKVVFIRKGELANIVDLRVQRDFSLDRYYMELNGMQEEEQPNAARSAGGASSAYPQGAGATPLRGVAYTVVIPPAPVYPQNFAAVPPQFRPYGTPYTPAGYTTGVTPNAETNTDLNNNKQGGGKRNA